MTTPLDPTLAQNHPPIERLLRLPHEVLVHGVLPHLAARPKDLRQLARVSRVAREKCRATAAYILRSNVHDVLEGTDPGAGGEQGASSVRFPRFSVKQVRGAHVYLDGITGRAQLAAAHRQKIGQPTKAVGNFTYVLERWPDTPGAGDGLNEALLQQTSFYLANSRPDAALDNCHRILRDDPRHAKACHLATDILRKRGEKSSAASLFAQLMEHSPISHDRVCFAELLVELGDFMEARAQLSFVPRRDHLRNIADVLLGQCELAGGAPKVAEQLFRNNGLLVSLKPPFYNFFVGEALFAQARLEEAYVYYRRVINPFSGILSINLPGTRGKRGPQVLFLGHPLETATARLRVADALFDAGQFFEAEERYRLAADADSSVAEVHYGLGRCRLYRGENENARTSFMQAIALRAGYPEALVELQRLGHALNEDGPAVSAFVPDAAPLSSEFFSELGLAESAGFIWNETFPFLANVG